MHIAKLAAMAFIENHHHMLVIHRMLLVLGNEAGKLLDGSDDNASVRIFQLPLQHRRRGIGVGRPFLEALVLLHGLVVQILAIHHEQHLVDLRQPPRQLRRLETGQRFSRAGGVPDVPARSGGAQLPVVGAGRDTLQNLFSRHDLIGPHHQELTVHIEHAVAGQDIQQCVFGERMSWRSRSTR